MIYGPLSGFLLDNARIIFPCFLAAGLICYVLDCNRSAAAKVIFIAGILSWFVW